MATTTVTETRPAVEVAQAHAPRLANPPLRMGPCSHYASWLKAHHHHLALQRLTAATHASFQLQAIANYKSAAPSTPAPSCSACGTLPLRPYFCLTCEATFCRHDKTASDHAASHAANEQHHLAWDLRAQALYCFGCNDHVRNAAVERFLAAETISHADSNQAPADSHRAGKRKRVNTSLSLTPPTAFGASANLPALNLLHSSSVLHQDEPAPADAARCPCIVHSTFAGESRSKITCGRCHHQSETLEPFLDLSLDLRDRKSGEMAKTLADCLRSYTTPENLPSKYSCAACGDGVPTASKRLSIKSLPSVLCIQFKRFEITNQAHKIDTPIRYPLQLDMGPYLTDHLEYPASYKPSNATRFGLMAVIAHEGTLSQGHYTCYIRGADDFFAVDDEKVRRASIGEVLAAKAYLVVYSRI
ncbi:hypothetical protein B0A53_05208 [Rhodotorula sp. CCFEE 5036]|nr:hypothetical protein B0A53_05208 [Rhodotorula sp. CCFEE 5036]